MPPVFAAIGSVIGAIGGAVASVAGAIGISVSAAAATSFVAGLAISAGLSLVAGLLRPKSKPPPARGSVTQISLDPDAPQPYAMGEGLVGGAVRHDTAYGPTLEDVPNPYRWLPIVYSGGGPVQEVTPYVDQAPIDFGYYGGFLATDVRLGACPDTALVPALYGPAPGWGSDSHLSGQAAIGWNLKFDKEGKKYASGVPQLGAYGKWVKVYDPRKDSTFAGGSGSHRLGVESTYEWSECPALHAGMYAYGRYQNGKRTIGVGLPADAIDWPNIAAWANVCDANSWRLFGIVYEPDDRWQNLKDIAAAGGGVPLIANGILSFHYSAPRISLETITEADISDADMTVTAMQSWRDRLNTIIPKYRSPEHNWELISADAVAVPTYVAEDGEVKRSEWPFNFVKDVDQAAQLARYVLEDGRELQPIEITCHPRFHALRPGDCVDLDLPSLGLDTPAVILRREFDPGNLTVKFILIGETPAKHAYALGETTTPPPTPAIGQTSEERDQISGAVLIGQPGDNGLDGSAGLSNAQVFIYQRSITTPALPTTTATYTFSPAGLTDQNNGWTSTIPADDGNPLWVSTAAASSAGATDTIAAGEWASPVVMAQDGINSATVFLYRRTTTNSAPALPSTTSTYTFATGVLTGHNNGWVQSVPASSGGKYLWITTASALGTGATDTLANTEWATPNLLAQDGTNGTDGSPGTAAITAEITVAAATVYAYADGTIVDFNTTYGKFTLKQGTTDITSSATLSIAASTGVTGQINDAGNTPIGSSPKGTYRATGLTVDNGTLTISAVYGGVTYTKVVALVKVKVGYEIVAALPSTNLFVGRKVLLTTDEKTYTYRTGGWFADTGLPAGANLFLGAIPGTNPNHYVAVGWNPDNVSYENGGYGVILSPVFGTFPGGYNDWTTPDAGTFAVHQTDANYGSYHVGDFPMSRILNANGDLSQLWPVEIGKTYEFSAYTGAHGCQVELLGIWYDGSGAQMSAFSASAVNNQEKYGGRYLGDYKRLVARAKAPAGAISCLFVLRKGHTIPAAGRSDSWMFVTRPMLAEVPEGSTDPVPWSAPPPAFFYADNIVANSLHGDKITAGTITTGKLFSTQLSTMFATIGLMRSATTGQRVEIADAYIKVFDASNVLRVQLGDLSA